MQKKSVVIKALGLVAMFAATAGTLLSNWVQNKEIEEQINERVDAKFAEMYGENADEEA